MRIPTIDEVRGDQLNREANTPLENPRLEQLAQDLIGQVEIISRTNKPLIHLQAVRSGIRMVLRGWDDPALYPRINLTPQGAETIKVALQPFKSNNTPLPHKEPPATSRTIQPVPTPSTQGQEINNLTPLILLGALILLTR